MSILMELNRPAEFVALRFAADMPPKSREYRAGFLAGVTRALEGVGFTGEVPHLPGTSQADAWYAGLLEGLGHLEPYRRANDLRLPTGERLCDCDPDCTS